MLDERTIAKSVADLFDTCAYVREDCEACGDCPLSGICLEYTPFLDVADLLYEGSVKDFMKYAYGGEAEAYRYEQMTEDELRWNYESEKANLERSDFNE